MNSSAKHMYRVIVILKIESAVIPTGIGNRFKNSEKDIEFDMTD